MFPTFPICFLAAVSLCGRTVKAEDKFDICKQRIQGIIRNGTVFNTTRNGVFRTIDNNTIADYIYTGPVAGMNSDFDRTSRQDFLTVTTEGCKVLCEDPIDWFWASGDLSLILGIVANWVLPIIALLAALPYDSDASTISDRDEAESETRWERFIQGRSDRGRARWLTRRSAWRTAWALLNWLGSPQTALTATFFNIWQLCQCFKVATKTETAGFSIWRRIWQQIRQYFNFGTDETPLGRLKIDAYYVLSCVGQFEFPLGISENSSRGHENRDTAGMSTAGSNQPQPEGSANPPTVAAQEPGGGGGQENEQNNLPIFHRFRTTSNTPALAAEGLVGGGDQNIGLITRNTSRQPQRTSNTSTLATQASAGDVGQSNREANPNTSNQPQGTSSTSTLATQEPVGDGLQSSGEVNRNTSNQPQGTDNTSALATENSNGFLGILVYGLLRPICDDAAIPEPPVRRRAREMTTSLLQSMAFQMRMLRRQGLYVAFANILLFFIAFVVSAVLAFADIGQRTTAHSLAFGIFIGWLPLLVLFAILDRNPTSAARTSDLISRWMWNVRAVREWEVGGRFDKAPQWWPKDEEDAERSKRTKQSLLRVSDFVGQGRQAGYNGVAFAVLDGIRDATDRTKLVDPRPIPLGRLDDIARNALYRIRNRRPPFYWWVSAFLALALVWTEVGAALLISTHTPTVGVGCRALLQIVYGALSGIPLLTQLFLNACCGTGKHRVWRAWARRWSDAVCLLAVLTLLATTFCAFSGVLKNCTCRGGFNTMGIGKGGYVDFENAEFYRDPRHFSVAEWWYAAAAVGSFPALASFIFFILELKKLRRLWKNNSSQSRTQQPNGRNEEPSEEPNGRRTDTETPGNATGQAVVQPHLNGGPNGIPGNTNGPSVGGTGDPGPEIYNGTVDMCWLG